MAIQSFDDLLQALREHPEWREELRRLVLTDELLSLPQLVRDLATQVEELAHAQQQTQTELRSLAEAQKRTEERVGRLEDRVSGLVGDSLERRYRERAYAYFGSILRNLRVISLQEFETQLASSLSGAEIEDLALADVLISGQPRDIPDAPSVWLSVEVSEVIDRRDVERALRRAELLRRAGMHSIPTVAGKDITQGAWETLQSGQVLLLQDGGRKFWDQALNRELQG